MKKYSYQCVNMESDEGPGEKPPDPKNPRKAKKRTASAVAGETRFLPNELYMPYSKLTYKRLYPEGCTNSEFKVFIESTNPTDKIGNKSPVYLNNIFSNEVKGVQSLTRINANKICVTFKLANTANNFLQNNNFLNKYEIKAYIPAAQIEKTGVIRFVPTNISNEDLYTKLSSIYEIITVRRFTKKLGDDRIPLQTISLTFLSNTLPDRVQYDLFSYRVFEYVPPLQQCFKCFKFNHSAKVCNNTTQKCSICSGEHSYKDCDRPNEICCINCSGAHLAISRLCPIKIKKMNEKKNKITYSNILNTKSNIEFPALTETSTGHGSNVKKNVNKTVNKNVHIPVKSVNTVNSVNNNEDFKSKIIESSDVLSALVQTLLQLANSPDGSGAITSAAIKDLLIKNLS